jgi:hypothetical protein
MKLNVPISLVLMFREYEIELYEQITTYKFTVAYTGFPYHQAKVRFMIKYYGRNREFRYQDKTILFSKGLTIMCFCSPEMRLIDKMIAVKSLREPIQATWQSQAEIGEPNQLLIIDHNRRDVEAAEIVPVDDFKKVSLVYTIIQCLAAWRISRDDIPRGIIPDHLRDRIWEIRTANPIFGELGPICTNPDHTDPHFGCLSRSIYLPRVLRAWAPPPEAEDPEAGPGGPHP